MSEEKKREFEKREKEEFKKLEKIFKKDAGDVDEMFQNAQASQNKANSLKTFKDRIAKTIQEIMKQQKI